MITTFNDRKVELQIHIEREPEDCFIESAVYVDTGEALDADELDEIQEESCDLCDEAWAEAMQGMGDRLYDEYKDSQYEPE